MSEPIVQVIARSSLGGHAWCANCRHPDLNHRPATRNPFTEKRHGCEQLGCDCGQLRRMTPEEWLEWKYPDIAGSSQP